MTPTVTNYVLSQGAADVISETAALRLPDPVEDKHPITMRVVPEAEDRARRAQLRRLAELSGDDDSLDWQLLSRIDVEAWGADARPE